MIADLLPFLLQGSALGISAALSPGPFQSLVIAESLVGGFRRGAPVAFAPLIADLPIAGVLVFAVNQIPASFLDGVRIAGAGLLLYLAWGSFKVMQAATPADDPPESSGTSFRRGLIKGILMLFLSPGPYLYWSLVNGPILLRALDQGILAPIAFLASFYTFSIGGLLLIAWLLGRAGQMGAGWRPRLQTASLLLLVLVALYLLADLF